jgi:hypothetical protein
MLDGAALFQVEVLERMVAFCVAAAQGWIGD